MVYSDACGERRTEGHHLAKLICMSAKIYANNLHVNAYASVLITMWKSLTSKGPGHAVLVPGNKQSWRSIFSQACLVKVASAQVWQLSLQK